MGATVQRGFHYADTIPYDTPESLDQLRGPVSGVVQVRPHIDTSPDPVYEVADPTQRWSLYSAVVRDGLPGEQEAILNKALLLMLWPELNLPIRCRATWEERFPELGQTPRARAS